MSVFSEIKKNIQLVLNLDDNTLSVLEHEYNCRIATSNKCLCAGLFFVSSFLLICFSSLISFGLKARMKLDISIKRDFIFISTVDKIFRTKNLQLITGNMKYSILYLPNLHLRSFIRYIVHYKKTKEDVYFIQFKFHDIWLSMNQYHKLFNNLNLGNSIEVKILKHQIAVFLLYNQLANRYFSKVNLQNTRWLFEHQKFYFLPIVHFFKERRITTIELQHGRFNTIKSDLFPDFYPLYCDYVFCCSKREKDLYLSLGVSSQRVCVLGAPLQSLRQSINYSIKSNHHPKQDLLVILSCINEISFKLTTGVLEYLNNNYSHSIIKLRFRPRTYENDYLLLKSYISSFIISKECSLSEDIYQSKKIICFSDDALYEVADSDLPFIFFDFVSEDISYCSNKTNYKQQIDILLSVDKYFAIPKQEQISFLGERRTEVIKDRFSYLLTNLPISE